MTEERVQLEGNQKEVARYISNFSGVSHSEIVEGTGIAGSSVGRATKKLTDRKIIKDTKALQNETSYVLRDTVSIVSEADMSSLLTKTTGVQGIGIFASMVYTSLSVPIQYMPSTFLSAVIAVSPALFYSVYKSLNYNVYAVRKP